MTVLPSGTANPNHPCNVNPERERRAEEAYTDAMLLMEAARRVSELQDFLASLTPTSNEGRDCTEDMKAMMSDAHDFADETVRDMSPEAYRDWLAQQRPRERLERLREKEQA